MKSIRLIFFAIFSIFVLSACAPGPFFDDFSEDDSTWALLEDDSEAAIYFQNGTLRLDVFTPELMTWTFIGSSYSDVTVEVEAEALGDVEINEFGLICRYMNEFDFYTGMIGSDGYFAIYKGDEEYGYTDISEESYGYSEYILGLGYVNDMRLDCIGNTITLNVNGVELISVEDNSFNKGDVGLITSSWDTPDVFVAFDNFSAEPVEGK